MDLKWVSHLPTEEQKEPFRQRLRTSQDIFDRLVQILSDKDKVSKANIIDFTTPSWAEKCAYELGYQKAIKEITDLLSSTKGN